MTSAQQPTLAPIGRLDDFEIGTLRLARVDGHRICVARTETGIHAIDNACPHEGYGLTQGDLAANMLTCQWHNWKFRVDDGTCIVGEEDVTSYPVTVAADGTVLVALTTPDPGAQRDTLVRSLRRGIERDYVGQVSRDVVRLLRADADPGELVWEAVAYGAPRAEFGWGHSIASAADCLAMVDLFAGDQRALPIVQAIAGVAESERNRALNALPEPLTVLPADPHVAFRAAIECEQLVEAQQLVRGALQDGYERATLRSWFTSVVCDHHLSYGHGAIYAQKAFELLDRIGWDRADTVLPHLVPTIVYSTREDRLPYMRPFTRQLAELDLASLARIPTAPSPARRPVPGCDVAVDDRLVSAILGADKRAPIVAAVESLRDGAGIDGVLDAVVIAASERMLRYDTNGERDFEDDFGWLDITHALTYANAARWHANAGDGPELLRPELLRLALFSVFLAHYTGRHEWHTRVADRVDVQVERDIGSAAAYVQREALADHCASFIVQAHAVKTSRAAAQEAERLDDPRPLQAALRFVTAAKLERFVAASVARSIDFLSGRGPRREESDE